MPAPFSPITAQRSLRLKIIVSALWTTRGPYDFDTLSSFTTSSPERGGTRKSNDFSTMRRGSSIFSILSSFLMRLCTRFAFAACALKRSMNFDSFASIACWRAYSASRRVASIARAFS